MGGFFGAVGKKNIISDVFFGTDYHSHLGTKSAGMSAYDENIGLQRKIHNIGNAPFRTKFEDIFNKMSGNAAIGCINDTDPQPLIVNSKLGTYSILFVGVIQNVDELIKKYIDISNGQLNVKSGGGVNTTELIAAFINQKSSFVEGIKYVHEIIDGTALILILTDRGTIIAARDKMGRLPVHIGKKSDGFCVSFENFAYQKLDYDNYYELGPSEIVEISADEVKVLSKAEKEMRICAFLWTYYGFPTSCYQGISVEAMRYKNGEILAGNDINNNNLPKVDCVAGVPDSGTPHAIGYANVSHLPFARPFIKYTPTWPRSFMPPKQSERNKVAKMKQIPVDELIRDKELLFVDDSIVRGTQLKETVDFLYRSGAKKVHMRSACPPIMYGCKFLNFSRATSDNELITHSTILSLEGEEGLKHMDEYSDAKTERGKKMRKAICKKLHLASLEYQTIEGLIKSIGLQPCKLCTYCWNGRE
ncbi:MAG: amidophosphoribosyltransferase [Clostridia bacterium]|nr:amidophosphoribosyltransferase [Clostridia bacterium]